MIEHPPSKTEILEQKLRSIVQEIGQTDSRIHMSVVELTRFRGQLTTWFIS